jgi:hypothetical protein
MLNRIDRPIAFWLGLSFSKDADPSMSPLLGRQGVRSASGRRANGVRVTGAKPQPPSPPSPVRLHHFLLSIVYLPALTAFVSILFSLYSLPPFPFYS